MHAQVCKGESVSGYRESLMKREKWEMLQVENLLKNLHFLLSVCLFKMETLTKRHSSEKENMDWEHGSLEVRRQANWIRLQIEKIPFVLKKRKKENSMPPVDTSIVYSSTNSHVYTVIQSMLLCNALIYTYFDT